MGIPVRPLPVKLIVGMIAKDTALFGKLQDVLTKKFGRLDALSPVFEFNLTDYYLREFGTDLKRLFLSFERLISPESLTKIKQATNALEKRFSKKAGQRRVNLDPGYVTLSKLVLASTKNYGHRIYAGSGIFQEITLYFQDGTFRPGRWTYPDYRTQDHILFFNTVREKYRQQIEKKYGVSQLYRCV